MDSKLRLQQEMEESTLDEIRTEIIHPIQINQQTARFNITNRGGSLDKHTQLVLPVKCEAPSAGDGSRQSFLPINVGIASVVRSVQLISASGVVICQNDNVGQWMSLSNSFQQQEFRKRVLKCRYGIFEDYEASESGVMNLGAASPEAPGRIGVAHMNYNNINPPTATSGNILYPAAPADPSGEIDSFMRPENKNYRITDNNQTAQLYLSLEAIFPKLSMGDGIQLPIHLINEGIQLVVQFTKDSGLTQANQRLCATTNNLLGIQGSGNGAGVGTVAAYTPISCTIDVDNVVLLTDYLVSKNDDAIAEQIMSPQGLTLEYGDLQWNNFHIQGLGNTNGDRNFKRDVYNLGASNQVIRQMYLFFNPTEENAVQAFDRPLGALATLQTRQFAITPYNTKNGLKNIYASKPLSYLPDGERINIKINQQNIYNQPLESSAHKLHELELAYNGAFCKPQSTYEFTDIVTDDIDFERYAAANGSVGAWFPQKSLMSRTASIQGWSCQELVGTNHFIGINLQKPILTDDGSLMRVNMAGSGLRVGPTPIVIEIDRLVPRGHTNDHRNMNVCMVVERTLNIREGIISIVDN